MTEDELRESQRRTEAAYPKIRASINTMQILRREAARRQIPLRQLLDEIVGDWWWGSPQKGGKS